MFYDCVIIFIKVNNLFKIYLIHYLIYSLNNLCLLSLSLTKKNLNICHLNVIQMRIIAICISFDTICLMSVSDMLLGFLP